MLSVQKRGEGQPIAFLHGFTQTWKSWSWIERELPGRTCVFVDLPGHGNSGAVAADIPQTAGLVAQVCGPGIYVGYSLGARVALQLALDQPEVVDALMLVGGSPGIADDTERAERKIRDAELASRIERDGVETFLESWLSQPMFAGVPRGSLEHRLANTAEGLASSLRRSGTGTMEPLWERLGEIQIPVLLVVGELDEKFSQIARSMQALMPTSRVHAIAGAGHAAHLERPAEFIRALDDFVSSRQPHGASQPQAER